MWKFPVDQDFFPFALFQRSLQEARCALASSPANKGTNVPSCFLNMQTYNKKEIGRKEIIRSTAVISI